MGPREVGSGCNQVALPGIMSSLIAQLLRAAQEDNPAEVKVPPDAGARRPSVAPGGLKNKVKVDWPFPNHYPMLCYLRVFMGQADKLTWQLTVLIYIYLPLV